MKATLTFNLPDEESNLNYALKGIDYKIALDDVESYLRTRIKHEEVTEEVRDTLKEVRQFIIDSKLGRNLE